MLNGFSIIGCYARR